MTIGNLNRQIELNTLLSMNALDLVERRFQVSGALSLEEISILLLASFNTWHTQCHEELRLNFLVGLTLELRSVVQSYDGRGILVELLAWWDGVGHALSQTTRPQAFPFRLI